MHCRYTMSTSSQLPDIIVFSHLRWEFVWQRPQHIVQRLSKNSRILFVEEPIPFTKGEEGTAHIYNPAKNITVLQPKIKWENFPEELLELIQQQSEKLAFHLPVLWFYSPMFVDLTESLSHSLVVFDCMDELSAFAGAPQSLLDKEEHLLNIADVVFTGGRSLYEAKRKRASNVYCFPSSVDREHFAQATKKNVTLPVDMERIPHPIVGFYGVIDERMDLHLLSKVAKELPQASFVLLGPTVKIDTAALPQRENIYYLGQKSYAELPQYLKYFDVAMMPFALNSATKFISPTKTLEFMAAYKPIVSTPIYDVVRSYPQEVAIAKNAKQFSQAIQTYLTEKKKSKKLREALQKRVIKQTSWDLTVYSMEKIINNLLLQYEAKYQNVSDVSSADLALFTF
jgi:glycosyltransferase involved in cell wall biosynthesis